LFGEDAKVLVVVLRELSGRINVLLVADSSFHVSQGSTEYLTASFDVGSEGSGADVEDTHSAGLLGIIAFKVSALKFAGHARSA